MVGRGDGRRHGAAGGGARISRRRCLPAPASTFFSASATDVLAAERSSAWPPSPTAPVRPRRRSPHRVCVRGASACRLRASVFCVSGRSACRSSARRSSARRFLRVDLRGVDLRRRGLRRPRVGLRIGFASSVRPVSRLTKRPSSTGGICTDTSSPSGFGSFSSRSGRITAAASASTIAPTSRRRARRLSSSTARSASSGMRSAMPGRICRPARRAPRRP